MKRQEDWKPKFLIDQNIGLKTVIFLRNLGFDAKILGELGLKGKSDIEIAETAKKEGRIIITFDKDFGQIYYFSGKGKLTAIVLHLDDQTSENVNSVLEKFFNSTDLKTIINKLAILYKDRVRLIGE